VSISCSWSKDCLQLQ